MLTIALMAHDKRKELMVQFCINYCRTLSKHKVCATAVTGKLVSEATGLDVERLMARSNGGLQQIGSMLANNEVDLVIYFRDTSHTANYNDDDANLLRLCDVHNIPAATNIATAEILVKALEMGELEFKDIQGLSFRKTDEYFTE